MHGEPQKTTEATEVSGKGPGAEIVVSPSTGKTVSGIVTITMAEVPSGTGAVGFGIKGPGSEVESNFDANIGIDTDESDGWMLRSTRGALGRTCCQQ